MDIIEQRYELPDSLRFTAAQLNVAITRNAAFRTAGIESVMQSNCLGIYRSSYRPERLSARIYGYYITTPGKRPSEMPGGNVRWYTLLVSEKPSFVNTRHNPIKRSLPVSSVPTKTLAPNRKRTKGLATRCSGKIIDLTDESGQFRSDRGNLDHDIPTELDCGSVYKTKKQDDIKPSPAAQVIANQTWWESPEAHQLFCDTNRGPGDNGEMIFPREYAESRIQRLIKGYSTAHGWRNVLNEFDANDICTPNDIFNIQMKCRYVSLALRIAVEDMPGSKWMECCDQAVEELGRVDGHKYIQCPRTVQQWHLSFRQNNESFLNPRFHTRGKMILPPLLERNPDFKKGLVQYATSNLNELCAEFISAYLHDTALPALLKEYQEELENQGYTMFELLNGHSLTNLSIPTIYRWMRILGFKYESRKRCYYVDGHEKPETKTYRKKFIVRYFDHEKLMHRWIQMKLTEKEKLEEEEGIELAYGHRYKDPISDVAMVEFHVDDHHSFQDNMNSSTPFGGNLSVRRPREKKPVVCFGQDEVILKQYCFTTKAWTSPTGQKAIIPKDEGMGVMISAFASREFGFGLQLTNDQLLRVNLARRGKKYSDVLAAKEVRGKADKPALVRSPFVVEFEYGANKQGYWKYDHMVLQFEDCVDVVKTLWPEYDYVFLFDHSCGHDRKRPDGLTTKGLNKGFGGSQPTMRPTIIEDCMGSYSTATTLKPGEIQALQFSIMDAGPCWMSQDEREATRKDRPSRTGTMITKQRLVVDLKKDLTEKGVLGTGDKREVQRLCVLNDIPVTVSKTRIVEGWEGKSKGMLQILFERGHVDPEMFPQYTVDGRLDGFGNLIPETSLRNLMEQLSDFQDEETLMQYHGRQMGVRVDRTPKCHPEMAGEGIEYDWACAKNLYRQLPISEKRTKAKFREAVTKCIGTGDVLTLIRQRLFSKRAREYMVAYHSLDRCKEEGIESGKASATDAKNPLMSAYLIEKIVKVYKTHRSAADFDSGFVAKIVRAMKGLAQVDGTQLGA